MEFGLFTVSDNYKEKISRSPEQLIQEIIEQSEVADQLGYDAVWFAEHHFSEYGIMTTPQMLLSVIAERTKNIRLGVAIVTLPFQNPIKVAEDYALLDVLSDGRVNLGLGSGYLPHEFTGFNVDPEEKVHMFNEGLEVIERAWSGEKFSHKGKYYQYNDVQLQVLPKQEKVPLWIGALSSRGAYYVGKMGHNLMGVAYVASNSITELKNIIDDYKKVYREAGHDEQKINIPIAVHAYVAPTREEAIRDAREHLNLYLDTRLYGRSAQFEDLEEREQLLIGNPEDVILRLKKYEQAGCNHIMMLMNFGGLPHEKVLKSMELVAQEVMPAFKKSFQTSSLVK
ncbi:alkanesulfonate monooxygenase SsuD/methylene tetrahydromethanopterin reductase-like flavin-dependent oxidoreductase (luciferase family) [Caldalkalibacillus uzonensis]|uniref:Alkanesulfonate monooxygenase SsuD/methylene tetrahydromethanopterin reductase-like flavin-dependent oxidoreductase (Luciferase family) n=1 Tax=Caldalkalibacillus uzonensis TaxID=353224 RepID=A0ABU0CXZ9_9BACI|nr:LLM class flavin-dependent oxidoreductase [Caldalkalibacillus uzonensis]MDQ0341021.1 alkanesulfonate monooxygenase SsuD/methylene tetrahydromethanopterin reductase-like flavin-dependent oxidoreductase (luciferase family) [Caldalkalibacillus uzonensis]